MHLGNTAQIKQNGPCYYYKLAHNTTNDNKVSDPNVKSVISIFLYHALTFSVSSRYKFKCSERNAHNYG
jgi:hypothetical protein